ncbi:MAG: type II secretion system minor pseudopilin GspJ [Moraxellaceae bacterium]|nr:type II secretion system minor pseudopilin GspJ [Moraxellaceae bacterium]
MNRRSVFYGQRGLTLVELLVAIVILGVLGLMSYRAVDHAATSRERLEAEYADWRQLARAFARMEGDLQQMASRGSTPDSTPALRVIALPGGGSVLVFWRQEPQQGARLTGLSFDGQRIELLRWPTGSNEDTPLRDTLLNNVRSVDWSFAAGAPLAWARTWPAAGSNPGSLPNGVRVEVDSQRHGKISRVFTLR